MQWIVLKQWAGMPATRQPATQERFPAQADAEKKAAELRPLFPNREFIVAQLPAKTARSTPP